MIAQNATEFGVLLMRKVAELTGKSSFVSPDEKYFGFTRDYIGTTDAQPAHTWVLLFKQVVLFQDETRAYLRHHVEIPSTLTTELERTVFRNSFKLRAINNDTLAEVRPLIAVITPYAHSHSLPQCALSRWCRPFSQTSTDTRSWEKPLVRTLFHRQGGVCAS